jgi:hypothetical protein
MIPDPVGLDAHPFGWLGSWEVPTDICDDYAVLRVEQIFSKASGVNWQSW